MPAMRSLQVGACYYFQPVDPKQPINGGKPSEPFYGEVMGFKRWFNGQEAVEVCEWSDGAPIEHYRAIARLDDIWTATAI